MDRPTNRPTDRQTFEHQELKKPRSDLISKSRAQETTADLISKSAGSADFILSPDLFDQTTILTR